MAADTKASPLVILGLDAGDPRFIQRWAQEGYLPTIASTMKRGCWGQTAGPELITEHGVWVSLFSGVSRSRHGYYFLRQLKPGTYDLQTVTGLDADAQPFWFHLRGQDKKVAIIDVPDAFPLVGLPGIQMADWAPHYPLYSPSAEPAWLLKDVRRVFGTRMTIDEKLNSNLNQDWQIYRRLLERIEKKGALCRYLLAQDRFDLVFIVFGESHMAGHQFWKYRPEAKAAGAAAVETELTHGIRDIYQAIDRQMGLLLAQLPDNANTFVISSVGIRDQCPTGGLIEAFCRQLGYQASPGPPRLSRRPIDVIRRFVPETWRIALSRNLPREVRERLLADQFRHGTDWQKTAAFAIPSLYTSFVRVNLRGREPQGIVKPGTEYEALLDRLEADLRQLIDPESGEPAVERVARAIDLFGGEPPVSLPDLFVEWKPTTHFIQRVLHPRAELVQQRPEFFRGSDHSQNGFVAAAGPSIRTKGPVSDVPLLDLAPTFLYLMAQRIPQKLTGKVIEAVIYR